MKILIVGAGIGGLTLAAFLKYSDIEYEIIDKKTNWDNEGFSIGLWNNGRHILAKLGLADKFDKEGSRIRYYKICDGKGNLLRQVNLSEFYTDYGLAYTHISRVSIHNWLLELVSMEKIQMGVEINSIKENVEGVEVQFNNGEVKEYDFVIGADGIHSKVRNLVFDNESEKFDNWRVWYAWIDNKFKQNSTVTEFLEAGEFVGIFDVGPKTLAVLIAPASHSVWDNVKGRLERLRINFKDEYYLDGFLNNLKNEDIVPTDLSRITLKNFVKGRVILLGDAAHGFEPHAGLGASMAMEDGYVLAGELMKISDRYGFAQAFNSYQQTRKKRIKIARSLTKMMGAWSFIEQRWLRQLVNMFARLIPQKVFIDKYHQLLKEEI